MSALSTARFTTPVIFAHLKRWPAHSEQGDTGWGWSPCLYPQVHPVWGMRPHNPTAATKMSNACFMNFVFLSALSIKTNFCRFFQARRTRKQGTFYGFGGLNGPKAPRIISKCVFRAFRESIQSYRFLPVRLNARTVPLIQTGVIQIQLILPVDHSSQMKPPPLPQQRCVARQLALVTNLPSSKVTGCHWPIVGYGIVDPGEVTGRARGRRKRNHFWWKRKGNGSAMEWWIWRWTRQRTTIFCGRRR